MYANSYSCRTCGKPIIFRRTRRNPKTGECETRRNGKVFPIHLRGTCRKRSRLK